MLITGTGGQGIVLAGDILGEVAIAAGYDVKKTDTLGMAQRGGSVVSHVRIGSRVWSPLIGGGDVDLLLGFEKLEAARWGHYLRAGAIAIVNNQALLPLSVNLGNEKYPGDSEITGILRQHAGRVVFIDGTARLRELGNMRALNIFMLGCASVFLPFKVYLWHDIISRHISADTRQSNIVAFNRGRKEIRRVNFE